MISRDPDAVRPGSQTAKRIAEYAAQGAEITVVLASLPRFLPVLWQGLRTVRRGWVVTSQDPFEAGLVAWIVARFRGARLELQMHGDFLNPTWAAEAWHRPLRLFLARWLLRRADGVRVPSQRVARSLEKIFRLGHVKCPQIISVPPGRFTSIPTANRNEQRIIYAGRFSREKNIPLLLNAFRILQNEYPQLHLILIGDGEKTPYLKEMRESFAHDRVWLGSWTGSGIVFEIPAICALPSRHESWGRFVIEASLAGCPVVMTAVGCAGEVIIDGESGWVVPPGDEAAFVAALRDALGHPDEARRRGENARRAAAALPNAEEIARRVVAAWMHLARA